MKYLKKWDVLSFTGKEADCPHCVRAKEFGKAKGLECSMVHDAG
ncbi:hypothetical protein SP19_103 [Salmonella phage 19]|nr:hypothetical protein SP19_103 [Salmonella phage 19]